MPLPSNSTGMLTGMGRPEIEATRLVAVTHRAAWTTALVARRATPFEDKKAIDVVRVPVDEERREIEVQPA